MIRNQASDGVCNQTFVSRGNKLFEALLSLQAHKAQSINLARVQRSSEGPLPATTFLKFTQAPTAFLRSAPAPTAGSELWIRLCPLFSKKLLVQGGRGEHKRESWGGEKLGPGSDLRTSHVLSCVICLEADVLRMIQKRHPCGGVCMDEPKTKPQAPG